MNLWLDVKYGARTLTRDRGFTTVAIFTLALGIGATSAIFSVVNVVLLKPLPFAQPEQLVVAWERCLNQGLPRMVVTPPTFADWRANNQVFQDIAAYRPQDFNLLGFGEPERIRGLRVTATMFSMLGVRPALGRDFKEDEDEPGKPSAAILNYGFWQRRFGASPAVIGQTITLGSEMTTIIGVMPPGFDFPPPISFRGEARPVKVELWTQLRYALEQDQRGAHNLFVLARLKEGVSRELADADLQYIAQRRATSFPQTNTGWDAFLVPLHQQVVGEVKTALLILPTAVGFVLLIVCANVANLLLVRATGRRREMAIRATLGAVRGRLIRQMLIENGLLALLGGSVGLALAAWLLKVIALLAPQNVYRLNELRLDSSVVICTLVVSILTALVFGLVPALQASRINLVAALKEGSAAFSDGAGRLRLRSFLVVAEVSMALLLLTGAGLLVRSFIRLQGVPAGFDPEHLTAMTLSLPLNSYPDQQSRLAFTERLMPKLAALPILQSVAFSSNLPLDIGLQGTEFKIEGQPVSADHKLHTTVSIISPGYFRTMETPLLRGRDFSASDNADAPGVVIVNSHLARQYFPGQDPLGKRIDMGFRAGTPLQIIGVAADVRHETLNADIHPGMYLPYAQATRGLPLILLLRGASDPTMAATAVRQQVHELDAQLPIYDVKTMNQVLDGALARPRFVTLLLTAFAGLAVLLAAVGIYGVMSYTVAQSTRELGIRMALGAQPRNVLRLVIGKGLVLTLLGAAIGLAGAFALTRLMGSLLFGVTATDPLTFICVPAVLIAVTTFACYLPARRATRVDPMVALRCD